MYPYQIAAKLACVDIYSPITPNIFSQQYVIEDVVCGTVIIDNILYIALQGTTDLKGWKSDFDIQPVAHPILGHLHNGFYENIPELVRQLLLKIPMGMKVICCGHSKGAANAVILSALLKLAGIPVLQNYLFACPNPGYKIFADWMQKNISGISYQNGSRSIPFLCDPVPEVPMSPYVECYPHTQITKYPKGWKRIIPTNWHEAQLYFEAINAQS